MELPLTKAVPAEQLPPNLHELVQAYIRAYPKSYVARLQPRFGLDQDQWYVLYGPNRQRGVVGFGPTITSAMACWETNFREAVAADQ